MTHCEHKRWRVFWMWERELSLSLDHLCMCRYTKYNDFLVVYARFSCLMKMYIIRTNNIVRITHAENVHFTFCEQQLWTCTCVSFTYFVLPLPSLFLFYFFFFTFTFFVCLAVLHQASQTSAFLSIDLFPSFLCSFQNTLTRTRKDLNFRQ